MWKKSQKPFQATLTIIIADIAILLTRTFLNNKIKHILPVVVQCFWLRYCGICHASLVFSVYTWAFKEGKYKIQVLKWHIPWYSTRQHCITALIIPCLNLRKFIVFFRGSKKSLGRFCFSGVFIYKFLKFLDNLWKIFGSVWKLSQNVQTWSIWSILKCLQELKSTLSSYRSWFWEVGI